MNRRTCKAGQDARADVRNHHARRRSSLPCRASTVLAHRVIGRSNALHTALVQSPTASPVDLPIPIFNTGLSVICIRVSNTSANGARIGAVGLELPGEQSGFSLVLPVNTGLSIEEGVQGDPRVPWRDARCCGQAPIDDHRRTGSVRPADNGASDARVREWAVRHDQTDRNTAQWRLRRLPRRGRQRVGCGGVGAASVRRRPEGCRRRGSGSGHENRQIGYPLRHYQSWPARR